MMAAVAVAYREPATADSLPMYHHVPETTHDRMVNGSALNEVTPLTS